MSKKPKELLPTVQLLTLKEPLLCQELQVTEELVAALRQKGFTVNANVLKVGCVLVYRCIDIEIYENKNKTDLSLRKSLYKIRVIASWKCPKPTRPLRPHTDP